MEESQRRADRGPGAEEVGRGPNAVAKSKVTTERVAVRNDQRAADSDVSGTK